MTVVQQHPAASPTRVNVPRRLTRMTGLTLASLLVLFGLVGAAGLVAGDGMRVVGRDAGPQVLATAGLYHGLSDMDAQVADVLLMGREYGDRRAAALARYEQRRAEANQALLKAFELTGDDPAERVTIQSVLDGLGRYEWLAGRAMLLDTQAAHAAGPPPETVLKVYRQATDLMRLELMPKAYNLTLESGTIVRRTHDETGFTVRLLRDGVLAAGGLALVVLAALQVTLSRRFRRTLSPPLLTATALTLALLIAGVSALAGHSAAMDEAKQGGFDAMLTLSRARAVAGSLHADQARYLLDPDRADTYEHAFLDKSQSLVYTEGGNVEAYHATLARAKGPVRLGMLRGRAEIMKSYRRLHATDGRMRAEHTSGRRAAAVATKLGPLAEDYAALDTVLAQRGTAHRATFDRAVASGDEAMAGLWRLAPFGMAAIVALVVIGVWPRLREYR
ncbi:hypothetical protein [Nonomuraea longicatena]|uniref:Secreted protein n=1 Tax=Nonomuraea longicatena TaxID=83682 RepID=A0ABN1PKS3_9ACTN